MAAAFPAAGKVPAEFLEAIVYPARGAARGEVRVGPEAGVDAAVIELPGGGAMAVTTDPCSLVPPLGLRESAWLTVHLLASDITTTGRPPMYALFDLNLPTTITTAEFEAYWSHIHEFCDALGCAIVGGHTARFEGADSTVAGGGTMITVDGHGALLTSRDARPGDRLLVTGRCGMSAAAILALSFPETIDAACGAAARAEAQALFYETSTAAAALAAVEAGRGAAGVTAMHDATEGGVRGALVELAAASRCGLDVDRSALPVSESVQAIAAAFGLDAREIISAGALVIAVAPERERAVLAALDAAGIDATVVGRLTEPHDGMHWFDADGREPLTHPGEDPYWRAFHRALEQGAS